MSKIPMRVSFANAPAAVLKQIFGEAKNSSIILDALEQFDGQAHIQELFFYVNTDENHQWVLVKNAKGEDAPAITMANLTKQLSTLVMTEQVKRLGERSARYALPSYQPSADEIEDDGEGEEEQE